MTTDMETVARFELTGNYEAHQGKRLRSHRTTTGRFRVTPRYAPNASSEPKPRASQDIHLEASLR